MLSGGVYSFVKLPLILILVTILGNVSQDCHAYMFSQVGVDSNFLIDDDRVIFAQSDGSLTALAIDTGAVLRREKTRDYSGTFKRVSSGILLLQYDSIALLDATNFAVLWSTKFANQPNVLSNSLVSYDGNGLVEKRNLEDGAVRWAFSLPGALEVVAERGKVLINRAATYEDNNLPTIVMLDLENGREIFRKSPPPGIHWPGAFFDGWNIYVKQGSFKDRRSDYELENLLVWDLQGLEIRRLPMDEKLRKDIRFGDSSFDLDQKTFYSGRVYSNRWSIPSERFGKSIPRRQQTDGVSESGYDLEDGFLFTERIIYGSNQATTRCEIELQSSEGHWEGVLPYLGKRGRISAVSRISGRILIGSDSGDVECVNARTGESLWLYAFPTMRHTVSYSSYAMPPMMSTAAKTFRNDNKNPPTWGLKLLNQSAKPTQVVLDPEPINPFQDLPRLLAVAWGGAVIPLLAIVLLHIHHQTHQWNLAFLSLLLGFTLFFCFMQFGRVSPGSSVMLRIAILTSLIFGGMDTVKCFRRRKLVAGAVAVGLVLALSLLFLPFLIRM